MLPKYYRFRIRNSTDQTFTYNNGARIEVKIITWKMSSGAMVFNASEISDTTAFLDADGSLAPDAETEGAAQDNSSDLYIGFTGTFYGKADQNSTDGALDLYMEFSTDNSRWPSDMADFDITKHCTLIGKLEFSTDAEDEDACMDIAY